MLLTQQPSPPPTRSPIPQENHPPQLLKLTPPTPSFARFVPSPPPPLHPYQRTPSLTLTPQNATALRLRLKFAMYKLKTNQHDIPLSRLELLSSPPKRSSPPARPSTAVAECPNSDEMEEPGSATPRPRNRQLLDLDLDLNVEGEGESPEKVEMLTPLPRHMQVEAAAGGDEELTSSGVKGRAADGLLSLMGVRE